MGKRRKVAKRERSNTVGRRACARLDGALLPGHNEGASAMEQDTFDSFEWFDDLEAEYLKRSQSSGGNHLFPMAVNMLLYESPRHKKN